MGRRLFQNRTRTDGTQRRGLLVARLAAVERVEIHPRTEQHLLAQPHLLQPCGASEPRTAPLHLPPLGRAGQPPLSDRIFGRRLHHVGFARLPALLQLHCLERPLRILEPRHRRTPHGRPHRPRTLHPLDAIRRHEPRHAHPLGQERRTEKGGLALRPGACRHPAQHHPPALRARTLHLHHGPQGLRRGDFALPADVLRVARGLGSLCLPQPVPLRRRHPRSAGHRAGQGGLCDREGLAPRGEMV